MNPPMKRHKTLTEFQREEMGQIIKDTLQDDYAKLELYQLNIKEDAIEQITEIDCRIVVNGKKMTIKGKGRGPVDALFTALVNKLSKDYHSLEKLSFARFSVEADINKDLDTAKTDGAVHATLEIDHELDSLLFREWANSVSIVSAKVVLSTIEHFVNAEKAVVKLYEGLQHARKSGRGDMINVYTQRLTGIVKNVSYEKVIQRLKDESRKNTAP